MNFLGGFGEEKGVKDGEVKKLEIWVFLTVFGRFWGEKNLVSGF